MKFYITGQEKGDLLIQVTAWTGLTIQINYTNNTSPGNLNDVEGMGRNDNKSVILIYMYIFVEQITGTRRCIVLIFFNRGIYILYRG
jgi:hypothetical protein